jgi:hypothetical protein
LGTQARKLGLIRDVLDKQLLDRDEVPLGRVDGIILLIGSEHSRPRVIQIESGLATLGRRIHPALARLLHRFSKKLGWRWKRPVRIAWSKIESIGKDLKLDLCGQQSPLLARERWLRDHVIGRIPGSGIKPE